MDILVGRQKQFILQNKCVRGLNFTVELIHGTLNTDLVLADLLPENIIIGMTLVRGGQNMVVMNPANLRILHLDSTFYRANWNKIAPNVATLANWTEIVQKGAAAYNKRIVELAFDFHGCYDLTGTDELIVDINFQSNAVSASADTNSKLVVTENIDDFGFEKFTPFFNIKQIQPGESTFQDSYNNLKELRIINLDKTSMLYSAAPVTQASLTSELASYVDVYSTMLTKRVNSFFNQAECDARTQCFDLYNGDIARTANLNLTLASTNINSNKNYIVSRLAYQDARLFNLYQAKVAADSLQAAADSGVPIPNNQIAQVSQAISNNTVN